MAFFECVSKLNYSSFSGAFLTHTNSLKSNAIANIQVQILNIYVLTHIRFSAARKQSDRPRGKSIEWNPDLFRWPSHPFVFSFGYIAHTRRRRRKTAIKNKRSQNVYYLLCIRAEISISTEIFNERLAFFAGAILVCRSRLICCSILLLFTSRRLKSQLPNMSTYWEPNHIFFCFKQFRIVKARQTQTIRLFLVYVWVHLVRLHVTYYRTNVQFWKLRYLPLLRRAWTVSLFMNSLHISFQLEGSPSIVLCMTLILSTRCFWCHLRLLQMHFGFPRRYLSWVWLIKPWSTLSLCWLVWAPRFKRLLILGGDMAQSDQVRLLFGNILESVVKRRKWMGIGTIAGPLEKWIFEHVSLVQ